MITVLGTAAATAFALSRARVYESRVTILYREVIPDSLIREADTGRARNMQARFEAMLMARSLLEQVVEDQGLFEDIIESRGMTAAIETFRNKVEFRARGGGTYSIRFFGSTPEQAQAVAAQLGDLLIEWELRFQLESVNAAKDFLAKERDQLEQRLREDERALAEFVATYPEFAEETLLARGEAGATIRARTQERTTTTTTTTTGAQASARLTTLVRQRDRISARLDAPDTPTPPNAEPTAEQRQAERDVANARNELATVTRQLAELQTKLTDKHPDVVAAKARVRAAEKVLVDARMAASALETPTIETAPLTEEDRGPLEERMRELDAEIAKERTRLRTKRAAPDSRAAPEAPVVELETEWSRLVRAVRESKERHEALDTKAFTAEIMAASELAKQRFELTIIDPAHKPTRPAGTGRSVIVMLGFTLSGGLGLALALGIVLLDDRVFSRRDIERLEIGPLLTVIPPKTQRRTRG